MRMLSVDAFEASRRFIEATGRPLEIARFQHAFDGASSEVVLDSLSDFQNKDGGFGHALEPDLRAPESSVLCTTIAFQLLRWLETQSNHHFISKGMDYFLNNHSQEQGGWRIIPESADQSPRAPWWYQQSQKEKFNVFSLNPTAEVLGYYYDCRDQREQHILSLESDHILSNLNGRDNIEMHELLCCLRLLQTKSLPDVFRDQLFPKVNELIGDTVARDPQQWADYSLRPLQVVDNPQSPYMQRLKVEVGLNLDYEIATQNEDGSWSPTWSWDDAFPTEWLKAKKEWSGVITLEKLLALKNFNRIDGLA